MKTRREAPADQAYAHVANLLQQNQLAAVEAFLAPFLTNFACDPRLLAIAGMARLKSGQYEEAIKVLARACRSDPKTAIYHQALGDANYALRRADEALDAFNRAIIVDPQLSLAYIGKARALGLKDRHVEATALLESRVANGDLDHRVLLELSIFQTALARPTDAIETCVLATKTYPKSSVAWHNLAAAYCDYGLFEDALKATESARRLRELNLHTELVRARALTGLGKLDEAEHAFEKVCTGAPLYAEALRDEAQLIWMRTGDTKAASRRLAAGVAANPQDGQLASTLAKALHFGGDLEGARQTLAAALDRILEPHPGLILHAAELAIEAGDVEQGLALSERALAFDPELPAHLYRWCDAAMAMGRGADAFAAAKKLVERDPFDQQALARLATAARLIDHPLAQELFDYETLVRAYKIETPKGWSDLDSYLADLKSVLLVRHSFKEHPFDQSLRHGGQATLNLGRDKSPEILAFATAIDEPIRVHIEHLRALNGRLGARARDSYQIIGAWSVLLQPGGYHHDHIHHLGWLSSAFYVEVPDAPPNNPHEGWIRFGAPGIRTSPALGAQHAVKPEPGTLVLFPSHMWHGTIPFTAGTQRMTIAFDVTPKSA